ncbi:hypothetical protein F5Y14DRAFT_448805 [Nemania sp. NC0429]|nr:hypothetical protein F5Y14DRAFT_448805 [Nemania sp. NC0429]
MPNSAAGSSADFSWPSDYPDGQQYTPTTKLELTVKYGQDVLTKRVMHLSGLPQMVPPEEIMRILNGFDITRQCRVLWPLNSQWPGNLHLGWCHVVFSDPHDTRIAVELFNGQSMGDFVLHASISDYVIPYLDHGIDQYAPAGGSARYCAMMRYGKATEHSRYIVYNVYTSEEPDCLLFVGAVDPVAESEVIGISASDPRYAFVKQGILKGRKGKYLAYRSEGAMDNYLLLVSSYDSNDTIEIIGLHPHTAFRVIATEVIRLIKQEVIRGQIARPAHAEPPPGFEFKEPPEPTKLLKTRYTWKGRRGEPSTSGDTTPRPPRDQGASSLQITAQEVIQLLGVSHPEAQGEGQESVGSSTPRQRPRDPDTGREPWGSPILEHHHDDSNDPNIDEGPSPELQDEPGNQGFGGIPQLEPHQDPDNDEAIPEVNQPSEQQERLDDQGPAGSAPPEPEEKPDDQGSEITVPSEPEKPDDQGSECSAPPQPEKKPDDQGLATAAPPELEEKPDDQEPATTAPPEPEEKPDNQGPAGTGPPEPHQGQDQP